MEKELQEKIKNDFPDLCSEDKIPSAFVFGFMVGNGWFDLIYNLCKDISMIAPETKIAQVKEKFGGLRFYIYSGTDEVYKLIDKAEKESFTFCERCGKKGRLRGGSWLKTLCDDCNNERN